MRMLVQRDSFLEGCRLAERALPERALEPARAHLLVRAGDGTCTLGAGDREVGLRLELEALVEDGGEALLPARQAVAILREAEADEVWIESAPGRVRVRGEGAEFVLVSRDLSAPSCPGPFPEGTCHELPPDLLRRALQRTLFAAGVETPRYCLRGILWELEPDRVRLVATDNKRLAVAEVPAVAPGEHLTPARRLVPARAMALLARLAADGGPPVRALFGMRHALFRVGPATLGARYPEGAFPAWRRAVPQRARYTGDGGEPEAL